MTGLGSLVRRNCQLYFKDRGMFLSSLLTPLILLVLYATFLARVYRATFLSSLPQGISVPEALLGAVVGGQLLASILSVSAVTVAFCSNLIMIQDKVTGAWQDLRVTPVSRSTLAVGYFLSCFLSTFLVCLVALGAGLVYLACTGWYLSAGDVWGLLLSLLLLTLFGTGLSSLIHQFLSTQGQMSAVGTIVSSGYGFLCGAYMPISQFSKGLQRVLAFLPGTYGTALVKTHTLNGAFCALSDLGFPPAAVDMLKSALDCQIAIDGRTVSMAAMYGILGGTVALILALYVLIHCLPRGKQARRS